MGKRVYARDAYDTARILRCKINLNYRFREHKRLVFLLSESSKQDYSK